MEQTLIERINAKGQAIADEKNRIDNAKKLVFEEKVAKIKELAPRIQKLWDIAQTLLNNNMPLGEELRDGCGFPHWRLETDGIFHGLGFLVKHNGFGVCGTIIGFGMKGGGWDGESVLFSRTGEGINSKFWYSYSFDQQTSKPWEKSDICRKIDGILNGFDEYERKLLEHAESVCK